MKIRTYGFRPERKLLPPAMNAADVFHALEANNGAPIDKKQLIRASATTLVIKHDGKEEHWFAAMILRARDAKSYNHLREDDGKLVLTAKQLGEGKIAEVSYCIAHPETGSGFIASYHGSPGFSTLRYVCAKLFSALARDRRKAELVEAGADRKKKATVYGRYKGKLEMTQLTREDSLKKMLKEFKRVSVVELRFTKVQSTGGFFKKLKSEAVTETERFSFPLDFAIDDDLADEIAKGVAHDDVIEAFVEGTDKGGVKRRLSSEIAQNMMVLCEEEYDVLLSDLALDLENWAPTIRNSPVVTWMLKLLASSKNRLLLEV